MSSRTEDLAVGGDVEVDVGPVAHGGHCVARHEGRVLFVRHALPGERVRARITGVGPRGRFLHADAVEVIAAAPDRVVPPCPLSGPGGCGGCDWQHATPAAQRGLKAAVVREQLQRLARVDLDVPVAPVSGDIGGLSWRTRVRYTADEHGRLGFRAHASHDVVAVVDCPIATPGVREAQRDGTPVTAGVWAPGSAVRVVDASDRVAVFAAGEEVPELRERAADRDWTVRGDGFWQVHPGAADALADQVLAATADSTRVWDLYCGVGLFAGAVLQRNPHARVDAVEGDRRAAELARRNLADLAGVRVHRRDVRAWAAAPPRGRPDTVILDPPRSGAGRTVLSGISASGASRMVYVACDPASLARDIAHAMEDGWRVGSVEALDLFPMTHHVETVAVLDR